MKQLLDKASAAYYVGNPIMSDEEFDALATDYAAIGAAPTKSKSQHPYPMWSLNKVYTEDPPFTGGIKSPKLDGAAIRLTYSIALFAGATRGNGVIGEGITDLLKHYAYKGVLPIQIPATGTYQIVGEMVAPKHIKNSRNYAAGALNLKSIPEAMERELTFIAYGIEPHLSTSWSSDMAVLRSWGFNTVLDSDWDQFPQDGTVYRIDSYAEFNALGYTSKYPRGAYAHKVQSAGEITTLLDVVWSVGRSGVVSPVAILEPVEVEDAIVAKATLHNMAYINALNLDIGCKVRVIRSGGVIPRIIGRVYD